MKSPYRGSKCPVCHMAVQSELFLQNFRGIEYKFCTEHCKERFKKHPHVFVGDARFGKAEKQKGMVVKKAHKIKLKRAPDELVATLIGNEISALMGIENVDVKHDEVTVVYDLLQVSLADIEKVIEKTYGNLDEALMERVQRGIIHYSEECELDNLGHLTKDSGYR